MEKVQNRVFQDRRRLSRISVQMECRFKSAENEFGALLLDLSQGGALLSSTLLAPQENLADQGNVASEEELAIQKRPSKKGDSLPEEESKISITLEDGSLKGPMTLSGTVKRSSIGMSEYGKVAQFGVEFEHTPLELLRLISRLSSRRKASRVATQIECRYKIGGEEYAARILDLSQQGALLYSAIIPDLKSRVSIIVEAINMGVPPLTLEGTVTRNAVAGDGDEGQFGVEFENPPSELRLLINAMHATGKK